MPGSSHVLELTGLQFGDVGAAAHVIRALLADGDAAKVDGGTSVIGSGTDQGRGDHGGARIGMSVADGPKVSRCCRCSPLRQQRRTNARAWLSISGVARTFSTLKCPSGSAVELHPEDDGWLAAWAGLEPARDLFLHAMKPGGGLEPPNLRLTRALTVPRGRSVRLRRRSGHDRSSHAPGAASCTV